MSFHKIVEVDKVRYMIVHPDPELAWEIGIELTKMIGEPVAALAQSAAGGKDNPNAVVDALPKAVGSLLQKLDPHESLRMVKRILASVEIQGEVGQQTKKAMIDDATFKSHFRGKLGSAMKLMIETLMFTHEDFFKAILDGIANSMKEATQKL